MIDSLYILWNPEVIAFHLGPLPIRWYSLCWCTGLFLVYVLMHRLYKQQSIPEEKFEPMFVYCFIGILAGSRLGHCLFYEPEYFLAHPVEMFLPIRFMPDGDWKFTGYEGLASHGGTIGLMLALWFFARNTKQNMIHVLDNVGIVTPICACWIRLGNLMNSEIIGHPTDMPWAFIFERVDMLPRHPGQLYEAICYFTFFFIGWWFYRKSMSGNEKLSIVNYQLSIPKVGSGFYFGLCIFLIFLSRMFIELFKEDQVGFEADMLLNMGQLLSIPFVLLGLYCMLGGKWCRKFSEFPE